MILWFVLLFVLAGCAPNVTSDVPVASHGPPATLSQAQRDSAEAQAALYRTQARQLSEKPWWLDYGTGAAAVVAVVFSIVQFFANAGSARRLEIDNRFYEALKQLGDPTSPRIRINAAAQLAAMAPHRKADRLLTVQILFANLNLELDSPVIAVIGQSIEALDRYEHTAVLDVLRRGADHVATNDFLTLLAAYCVAHGYRTIADCRTQSQNIAALIDLSQDQVLARIGTAEYESVLRRSSERFTGLSLKADAAQEYRLRTERDLYIHARRISAVESIARG